jgi:tetraacyldisaccharide 4'-kinase
MKILASLRARWAARLQKAWYTPSDSLPPLQWLLLWSVSLLYGSLVALRRSLYRAGVFKTAHVRVPVVVVGNVIAGGAGKTPVTIALAHYWAAQGRRLGIVSRGYGRSSRATLEVTGTSSIAEVGDEPTHMWRAQAAPVFVATRRADAVHALLQKYPQTDVILCDDGLQHLALHRDVEICVFDERGVGNGHLLPAGPLREPWPRAVDVVLRPAVISVAAMPDAMPDAGNAAFAITRQLAPHVVDKNGARTLLRDLKATPVIAVAAIANPDAFFVMLRAAGITLLQAIGLPDHYDFDSWLRPKPLGYNLICTEKDAVKLWRTHPDALAVPLQVSIDPAFFAAVDKKLSMLDIKL